VKIKNKLAKESVDMKICVIVKVSVPRTSLNFLDNIAQVAFFGHIYE
jgi:hypothetical protein